MRNWITIVVVLLLLVGGGFLLSRLQSGQPLELTSGYVPVLDSSQAFILAAAVGFLVISTAGMGATLAALFWFGGKQIAVANAVMAGDEAEAHEREPAKAAPQPAPARSLNLGNAGLTIAVAANLLVLAFVAFLTLNHFVLNPPSEEALQAELPAPPGAQPTAPAPVAGGGSPGDLQAEFDALPPGDATRGQSVFSSQPCSSCHSLVPDQVLVGPSLAGVATRAETREAGVPPELYLYESVTRPGAVVVEGFQNGLMPTNFAQLLSPQQQADLIAYLQTLK